MQHVKCTASLQSADCETDNTLVNTKIHLTKPKKAGGGAVDHKPKKESQHIKDERPCVCESI